MTIVELHMNIDCDGCEENVRKTLQKLKGVHYVNVDRLHGKVTVTGSTSQKKVLRAARRTGKLAVLWPTAYNNPAVLHAYVHQPAAYRQLHSYHAEPAGRNKQAAEQRPNKAMSASSYNYQVHGYFDSELYGSYHGQLGQPDVVPAAVRDYFSDENPNACSIM